MTGGESDNCVCDGLLQVKRVGMVMHVSEDVIKKAHSIWKHEVCPYNHRVCNYIIMASMHDVTI